MFFFLTTNATRTGKGCVIPFYYPFLSALLRANTGEVVFITPEVIDLWEAIVWTPNTWGPPVPWYRHGVGRCGRGLRGSTQKMDPTEKHDLKGWLKTLQLENLPG